MESIEEMLKKYTEYKADISIIEHKIKLLENFIPDAGTSNMSGDIQRTGYRECGLTAKSDDRMDKANELKCEKELLESKINMLDNLIKTLRKFNQDIIKLYYIEQYTEAQIAGNNNREIPAIQKSKRKSINKMQEIYNRANIT